MQVLTIFDYKKIFLLDCKIQFTFDLDLSFHARIKIQKSILFMIGKLGFIFLLVAKYIKNCRKQFFIIKSSFLLSRHQKIILQISKKKHRTNQRKITRKSIHFQLPNFARKKVSSISEIFYFYILLVKFNNFKRKVLESN